MNLAFHSLLRWKMTILPILTTSLIHFSLKGWENVLFELGSERVNVNHDFKRCTSSFCSDLKLFYFFLTIVHLKNLAERNKHVLPDSNEMPVDSWTGPVDHEQPCGVYLANNPGKVDKKKEAQTRKVACTVLFTKQPAVRRGCRE